MDLLCRRHIVLTLVGIFLSALVRAQFSPIHDVSTEDNIIEATVAADIDGDSNVDIVYCDYHTVYWAPNIGNGRFITPRIVTTEHGMGSSVTRLFVEDIDVDGDVDIAISTIPSMWIDTMLSIYQNDGLGNFIQVFSITQPSWNHRFADLDTDGLVDLYFEDTMNIMWMSSIGNCSFDNAQILHSDSISVKHIASGDFDLDGDIDLLGRSIHFDYSQTLYLLHNDGNAGMTATEILLDTLPAKYVSEDYTGDGYPDFLAVRQTAGISIFVNDSFGAFDSTIVVAATSNSLIHASSVDIDQDGDLDLYTTNNSGNTYAHINDGGGQYQQAIPQGGDYQFRLINDLDGDGHLDAIGTACWRRNSGTITGSFPRRFSVVPLIGSCQVPAYAGYAPVDLDQDGHLDLVSTSDCTRMVAWLRDTGDQRFDQFAPLAYLDAANVATGDVDGDGDLDVLSTASCQSSPDSTFINWLENNGTPHHWPVHYIPTSHLINQVLSVDMDLDGDSDIVAQACVADSAISIHMNSGGGQFTEMGPFASLATISAWHVGDMNGDAFPDLVAADFTAQVVVWYPGDGSGSLLPALVINAYDTLITSLHAADIDSDLDMDIVTNSANLDSGCWVMMYINDGGGNFNSVRLHRPAWDDADLMVGDINGDLRPDLAVDWVAVMLNDSVQSFTEHVQTGVNYADFLLDVDGDGDNDAFTLGSDAIHWQENFFGSPYRFTGSIFFDVDMNGVFDSTDVPMGSAIIESSPQASYAYTDTSGHYVVYADSGSYVVTHLFDTALWNLSSDSIEYHVALTSLDPIATGVDFGITPSYPATLVRPSLVPGLDVCGGPTTYFFSWQNRGNTICDGWVMLELDSLLVPDSIAPPPDSIVGQRYYWSYEDLFFYEDVRTRLYVTSPSADNIGEWLECAMSIAVTDSQGVVVEQFDSLWTRQITCSFDPNDKQVAPAGFGSFGAVDMDTEWLDYTIRFQNTGNDTAYTVMLRDSISDRLDVASICDFASSHTISSMNIEQDRELVARFENIMLPDSGTNQAGSQGFLSFRARVLPGLASGSSITNRAYIYFDYNAHVITNTAMTTLVDCDLFDVGVMLEDSGILVASAAMSYQWMLNGVPIPNAQQDVLAPTMPGSYSVSAIDVFGCQDTSASVVVTGIEDPQQPSVAIVVFPNPSNGDFDVLVRSSGDVDAMLECLDAQGRLAYRGQIVGQSSQRVRLRGLQPGLYLVRLLSGQSSHVSRVIVVAGP